MARRYCRDDHPGRQRAPTSEFLRQLPALIGVVVGALGSYLAVVRGARARLRRESVARWEERGLAVCADYARTLKTSVTLTYRIAAHLGDDPRPARAWAVSVLEMERCTAVRADLELPPGHAARRPLPPVSGNR